MLKRPVLLGLLLLLSWKTGLATPVLPLPALTAEPRDSTDHGYAVEGGVRVVPMRDVELYAWLRHD